MLKKLTASRKRPTASRPGIDRAIRAALMAAPGVLFAGAAIAGPFGFDLKSSVEPSRLYSFCSELNDEVDGYNDGRYNFICTTAPKSHPAMEFYQVSFVEGVGVCGIQGYGKDISDSRWGYHTKIQVDRIANQIKTKYGLWDEKLDDIYSRSPLYDDPEDFMMSILEEERYYGYEWILHKSINSIKEISVVAQATNQDTGWVFVEFLTSLENSCEKMIEQKQADVF